MNKKGNLITDKPVVLIIGIVVFVLIVIGIFGIGFQNKVFTFLPSFPSDDDLDASEDEIKKYDGFVDKNENFLDFKQRDEAEVLRAMEYASENSVVNRRCVCGENCENYAEWIVEYSNQYEIPDALILVSLMMQESSCDYMRKSSSSYGLMQIRADKDGHCGKYGLPSDIDECQNEILNNPEKSIEVGIRILKESYTLYNSGRQFSGACSKEYQNVFYEGWKAALRGYNGWGCNPNYPEQDKFVEEVVERYNKLYKEIENE